MSPMPTTGGTIRNHGCFAVMVRARLLRAWLLRAVLVPVAVAGSLGFVAGAESDGGRRLAPGVMTVIGPPPAPAESEASAADTVLHGDLLDITERRADLDWTPKQAAKTATLLAKGMDREFHRDVWCLEFAFKPPRLIDIEVPVAGMKMRREQVLYVVYRVRNTSGRRTVVSDEQPVERKTERFEKPVRFIPQFVLETLEPLSQGEGSLTYRAYLDRVVPAALGPIQSREDPQRRFFDSAAMAATELAPGEERWGVAVWERVDTRIDFFSIYVRGLTNAVTWRQRPGSRFSVNEPPGATLEQSLKSLRLDFWSPGDDRDQGSFDIKPGFVGMFERMTLGSRLLDAAGRPGLDASQPVAGLERLGIGLEKLREPDAGDGGGSLIPLQQVVGRIAALPDPQARGPIVRLLFGDRGVEAFEDLARAVSGPVDADRDRARRAALATIDLTPESAAEKPLPAIARIVRALEAQPTPADRRAAAERFFGSAGSRIEWMAREVVAARTLAALEVLGVEPREIVAGDALAAFEAVQPAIEAVSDADKKKAILEGLFGPRGPQIYAAAQEQQEGVDHAWVFRYETDEETGF